MEIIESTFNKMAPKILLICCILWRESEIFIIVIPCSACVLSYPVFWQSKGQGAGFSPRTKQECALVCSSLFLQPPRAAEAGRAACAARRLGKHHSSCMRPKLQVWCAPTVHAGAQEPVAVLCLQPLRILHGGPTRHNRGTLLPSLDIPPTSFVSQLWAGAYPATRNPPHRAISWCCCWTSIDRHHLLFPWAGILAVFKKKALWVIC